METIALETANPNHQIALRGVRVKSRITALCHKTTIEQTFVNLEDVAIEAVYTFPLPESGAVCGFEVITGDRVLTGMIEESSKAFAQYEDAIEHGDAAFIVDAVRPDVFTVRVGNLNPKQAATIKLSYVCALERADKSIRVVYPTTIAPRYKASAGMDPLDAAIDADEMIPPHVLCVPYGLSLEVDVQLAQKIAAIRSPSHEIRVQEGDDSTRRVMLKSAMTSMDRDIVLDIELHKEHAPSVQVASAKDPRESYLAVTFVPEFDVDELSAPVPAETIFVLDCSGSMHGESLAQATTALELCLRALSPGDSFNICRFGSTFEMMSSEPLMYSDATLKRALDYIAVPTDLGGTELHRPLQSILAQAPQIGRMRNIILLTDGQVSNEPALVALARKHRSTNRIFTFGIGAASSAFLVKGLARATGGAAEFISRNERIEEKVLRTFGRIASPMITDVLVDWGDAEVQTLAELPPVFDGDVLTVFGRALGRIPKAVTLRCLTPKGAANWSIPVPPPIHDDGVIGTMWARRMIQSVEEVNDIRRTARAGSVPSREERLVIDLSKQFGLLSSLTTYIAVEHRSLEERNEGRPELRRIPVAMPQGWGDLLGLAGDGMTLSMKPSSVAAFCLMDRPVKSALRRMLPRQMDLNELVAHVKSKLPLLGKSRSAPAAPATHTQDDSLVILLLLRAQAEGWFRWDDPLERLAHDQVKRWNELRKSVESAVAQLPKDPARPDEKIISTLLALIVLRSRRSQESLWRRAYRKASAWLAPLLHKHSEELETWLDEIQTQALAA